MGQVEEDILTSCWFLEALILYAKLGYNYFIINFYTSPRENKDQVMYKVKILS